MPFTGGEVAKASPPFIFYVREKQSRRTRALNMKQNIDHKEMTRTMKTLHNLFVTNGYLFAGFIKRYSLSGPGSVQAVSNTPL